MRRWWARLRQRRTEAGYAAVVVAVLVPVVFIGCSAIAVDTSRWYLEMQRVQKAADAASLAGVPYLPQDFASAKARALQVAARNGYDSTNPNVTVTVSLGDLASQLKVTISSKITNAFGSMIGVPHQTITQSATADYTGPAPMGSPCNTFGNEPDPGSGGASAPPIGSAQGASPYTNCSRTPTLWATVEGPETGKVQGDRYSTKGCESTGVDGCTGTTNDEFDDFGYVFVVKVQPAAVGTPVNLELYDPEFANSGQSCGQLPTAGTTRSPTFPNNSNNTNPYVINSDANSRYTSNGTNSTSFCTGDSFPGNGSGGSGARHPMTTSFVLRQQTDTQNPEVAPVQNDTGGAPCIRQYGAYNYTSSGASISSNAFVSSAGAYNEGLAQTFHNWVSMCTFTPQREGDYYLQVRTDVSLAGTVVNSLTNSGNAAAAATTGNTTSGEGSNSFAIRAVTNAGLEKQVAVSGFSHMPIYINADTATATFNLIRVLPGAAGQFVSFSYFDAGDAAANGDVKVLPPTDATGSITSVPFPSPGCSASGGSAGASQVTLSNCDAPITQNGSGVSNNNGKTEIINIPIPTDYNCNYISLGGCWYRVQVSFGTGSVHDVTTWNATVVGDPVRLIK